MLKKINKETLLYIFILLNPLFDLLSSLYVRLGFPFTPSTFLRPIIPFVLLMIIIITDRAVRKKILLLMTIYVTYAVAHITLYYNLITGISYGTVAHELQYLINYTYLIFTLITFIYVFYKKKNLLINMALYNFAVYLGTIYLAIITGTSLTSYIEGTGYKGWFSTSGAVGTILILSSFVLISYILEKNIKFIFKLGFVFIPLFYLCFLLGSRVGLYGTVLVLGSYLFASFIYFIFNFKKFNFLKQVFPILICLILLTLYFFAFGSYTLNRRNDLNNIKDEDKHIAYDLIDIKNEVDTKTGNTGNGVPIINTNYISIEQTKALNSLYKYANETDLANVDLRKQQLIYHTYLYQYQDNVLLKLFGNGYLANFGALTLEMELIALFYNFGLIGFILYFGPFLAIFSYGVFFGLKNIKKIDIEYMMYLAGIGLSYFISFLAGHVYFNTSIMPIIIIIHLLLLNKIYTIKKEGVK